MVFILVYGLVFALGRANVRGSAAARVRETTFATKLAESACGRRFARAEGGRLQPLGATRSLETVPLVRGMSGKGRVVNDSHDH